MLTLINTNRMLPPIAPIGLDYVACAARRASIETEVLDLCPVTEDSGPGSGSAVADPLGARLADYFSRKQPELVGLSFRNVDDCFWPSGGWFVPQLQEVVAAVRAVTDAPIVVGGVGFSIFARQLVEASGADFGIRGDGEQAIVELIRELRGARALERVSGLLWRKGRILAANPPAWPQDLAIPPQRDAVNNAAYFRHGGQVGLETKRGCDRSCAYCADPLAKGPRLRPRNPEEIADEVQSLIQQGVDVLHLCDSEFNVAPDHARAVCDALIRRGLGGRVRWYAYLAVTPFDADLAQRMARAGCVGINFTSDSAAAAMLAVYRQPHRREHLAEAVRLCRDHRIAVMLDLLLGGPGETPETVTETIRFFQQIGPDCVGSGLGLRLYPGTAMTARIAALGPWEQNPGIRRHYSGPIDLVRPTFFISPLLGERPARLVHDLIGGDSRFFPPEDEHASEHADTQGDHNYNANQALVAAIRTGARGAYWDILRRLRVGEE